MASNQPHRKSISLIRNFSDEGWRWLAVWNRSKSFFEFISADCLENESPREAISREVAWTLDLDRGRDILVCNMAQANLDFQGILPGKFRETNLKVAFFNVELYGKRVVEKVNSIADIAWLTSQEICDGKTMDNLEMDPILTFLIQRSQVIQHWESSK